MSQHLFGCLSILGFAHQLTVEHHDGISANDESGFALARSSNNFSPRDAYDIIGWRLIRMRPLPDFARREFEVDPDLLEQFGAPRRRGCEYDSGFSHLHVYELTIPG